MPKNNEAVPKVGDRAWVYHYEEDSLVVVLGNIIQSVVDKFGDYVYLVAIHYAPINHIQEIQCDKVYNTFDEALADALANGPTWETGYYEIFE